MSDSKAVAIIIIVFLFLLPAVLRTDGQVAETPTREIDAVPVKTYDDYQRINLTLDQGWAFHPLTTILTGPGYYHRVIVSVQDNINRTFGSEDYYKIRYDFDLLSTLFDPKSKEIIVEDGVNASFMINLDIELNDQLNLTSHILSIDEEMVNITLTTQLQTYYVQTRSYDLNSTRYEISTLPLRTMYASNGSFAWSNFDPSYLLLDENIAQIRNKTFDIVVSISINVSLSTDDEDKIRIEVNGNAATFELADPQTISVVIPVANIMDFEVSVLSGPIEFEIGSVQIDIDPDEFEQEQILPPLPRFGWIAGIVLYLISTGMVYKFMQVKIEMEEEK